MNFYFTNVPERITQQPLDSSRTSRDDRASQRDQLFIVAEVPVYQGSDDDPIEPPGLPLLCLACGKNLDLTWTHNGKAALQRPSGRVDHHNGKEREPDTGRRRSRSGQTLRSFERLV
ncbi:hypothetical protein VZT92_025370 [Zoarces viviparus]|uniref:Uncharacterized protein n=1 Tax=Zoarces viviparus TaxID=48416 RepID=A0AAW1DX65_ZOAVI